MRVLTTSQMREADRRTIEEIGLPSTVLMENAGRQVVAAMESAFDGLASMRIAVLCGRGNNGGDGFVVARTLLARHIDTGVYLVGQAAELKGDARVNLDVLHHLGADVVEISDAAAWELHGTDVLGSDLIVDALFGTGLNAPLSGLTETIVADLNGSARPVVAIDLPSGLSADGPEVPGPAVHANVTVTLGAPKLPLVLPPAEAFAGNLVIADIGIPLPVINGLEGPWIEILTKESMRALIEPRSQDSHKGDYGHVLVVAGSRGKTGAAALAATAALRSGAGLVTVATPASVLPVVASLGMEFMTVPLEETGDGLVAFEALERVLEIEADVIAVGPGLGRSASTTAFVQALVERAGVPIVVDADALNAFAGDADRLVGRDGVDIVVTPHPGEMARLVGTSVEEVQAHRLDVARDFAATHRVHVVLKGHRTIVATPDGKVFINLTGNAGMATGGTGDVLTGMIAAWFGQLLDAEGAAKLAVYLHGLAGDLAEADEGEIGMIAGDLVDRLGDAVLELTARRKKTASQP
ncbi:MAG TPA: NAD(P)H-hydrate dehydratase [Vicinamibacterales bacterium]|nr:NAD(P)H-hydrate dehydratase [Vicinamibacterales bacterium]